MRQPRGEEHRGIAWALGSADETLPMRRDAAIVALFVALAAGSFAVPVHVVERGALVTLAFAVLARFLRVVRARRARARARAHIRLDARGIARVGTTTVRLAEWGKPLGVTVLSRVDRQGGLLVFTTPEQTRYVPLSLASNDPRAFGSSDAGDRARTRLLAMSTPLLDTDATAASEEDGSLSAEGAAELLDEIERRAPGATTRFYLSGTHGEPIVLEGEELLVGARVFDLASPLEWRSFTFHESTGQAAALYQATWVRQGGTEAVLVSPLPPDVAPAGRTGIAPSEADRRARVRDLRLQQAAPGTPPAREVRVGIERLFMLPLRRALDGAPRASRSGGLPPRLERGGAPSAT